MTMSITEFGTGIVKITPAHDFNDFEVGVRHNLEKINILNPNGTLNENAGQFAGQGRHEARKLILEELEKDGFLVKTEDYKMAVATCYRCHTVVEPYLSLQWFVKMQPLAGPAIDALRMRSWFSIPITGRKPIFTGWKISATGVYPGNFGGVIEFQPITAIVAVRSWSRV